jgi:hypothetical protein
MVVRVRNSSGIDEYHVMNGNNRVYLFGSDGTNPNNRGLPVLMFDGYEALNHILGVTPSSRRPTPFVW